MARAQTTVLTKANQENLIKLGVSACLDNEEEASVTVARAKNQLDLLLHHGSRFVGRPEVAVPEFFRHAAARVKIRMLLQRGGENLKLASKLEGLSADYPSFEYAFYIGPPIFRVIVIDDGASCLLSHYCDKHAGRSAGANNSDSGPQLVLTGATHSLAHAAKRTFEDLWDRGASPGFV